jgi:hypothetical protein
MPSVPVPQLGLFADNDQIEAARSAYESQLAAAMSGRGGMGSTANAPQVARSMGTLSGGPATTTRTGIAGLGMGSMGSTAATADTAPTAETSLARLNLNKQYADGGNVTMDSPPPPQLSRDGYGLGRLQAMADAGYAEGGETSLNLDRIPSLNIRTGSSAPMGYTGGMDDTRYMASDKGFGPVFANILSQMPQQERAQFLSSGMGEWTGIKKVPKQSYFTGDGRAVTGYAEGGETRVNLNTASGVSGSTGGHRGTVGSNGIGWRDGAYTVGNPQFDALPAELRNFIMPFTMTPGHKMPSKADILADSYFSGNSGLSLRGEQGNLNLNSASGLGTASYAKGGYLDGPGDGMSDSIPATIEGKQPARLADGEFVIPADVVSHLGNGSTKAGSKRLYAMLDKVRHARTGNKKQGKQINPNKFLPA